MAENKQQRATLFYNGRACSSAPAKAQNVAYDNVESGLSADNVQGAIDELNNNLGQGSNKILYKGNKTGVIEINEALSKYSFICIAGSWVGEEYYTSFIVIPSILWNNNTENGVKMFLNHDPASEYGTITYRYSETDKFWFQFHSSSSYMYISVIGIK